MATIEAAPVINNGYAADSIFYSATGLNFVLGRHYDRFGPRWPADAKLVTTEQWRTFTKSPPAGKTLGADANGGPTWIVTPESILEPAAAAKILNTAVDAALAALALTWGYNKGIDNATTWSQSSNAQFAAEGKALLAWRDEVWAWVAAQPDGTTSTDGMPAAPARPTATTTTTGA